MCPCCPWMSRMGLLLAVAAGLVLLSGCNCGCVGNSAVENYELSGTDCCDECAKKDSDFVSFPARKPGCAACTDAVACAEDVAAAVPYEEVSVADDEKAQTKGDAKVTGPLSYSMKTLDGKPVELSKYQGKVVLFVNVASKCGLTPQYKQLEALHEKYGDKGLCIIGVPANNFGGQEPGSDTEISEFCKTKYAVKFDMLSKVSVKGSDQCELYKFLTSKDTNPKFAGDITWNFEKFLVNRKGEVVNRFPPRTAPDAKEVITAIETELEKK